MNNMIEQAIRILQEGKQLPEEYQDILFPVNHAEYELVYKGKKKKQTILSSANEPQSVPFQIQKQFGDPTDWNNLLIFGDNYQILKTFYENKDELIKDKVKGMVKLIYIDPPFATSDEFANKSGAKAYSDKVKGAEFIEFLRQRLILAKEILAEDGSIFVHLDWKMSHYIKIVMDEVFGKNNLRNEIIWTYTGPGSPGMRQFNRKHDTILWYSKSSTWTFNAEKIRIKSEVHTGGFNNEMKKEESESYSEKGKIPEDWWYFGVASRTKVDGCNRTGYPTEKPRKLLERIIEVASNEGDIVMDFFAGSGTTGYVAELMNRKWIMCDIGKLSMYIIQKRFLTKKSHKPFALVNAAIYDLSEVFGLDKAKYDLFVKELFHIESEKKSIAGVVFDGKRRGDWVRIFDFHYFKNNPAIDEKYIEDLHKLVGKKVGSKVYIVAPEMNINILDDYVELDGVRYYLLRIPYQAIKELHKTEFRKPKQPKSEENINKIETSVGFYFNEEPEVASSISASENNIIIDIISVKPQYASLEANDSILAMVLLDTSDGKEFVMQKYYFADNIISKKKGFQYQILLDRNELKTNRVRIVYIDIFGNEFTETLEVK